MKTLISLLAFVLDKDRFNEDSDTAIFKVTNYANFLSQPLNLGMFIPCKLVDGKWVVLETCNEICNCECETTKEYQKVKERVLFEGFELIKKDKTYIYLKSKDIKIIYKKSDRLFIIEISDEFTQYASTIEDLGKYSLTLTAIK